MHKIRTLVSTAALLCAAVAAPNAVAEAISALGDVPVDWTVGDAKSFGRLTGTDARLENGVAKFDAKTGVFAFKKSSLKRLKTSALVEVCTADGVWVKLSAGMPAASDYKAPKTAIRHADALSEAGKIITRVYENKALGLRVTWSIQLREKSPYFTQKFEVENAGTAPLKLSALRFGTFEVENAEAVATIGNVPGSPVALADDVLCGIESPNFQLEKLDAKTVALKLPVSLTLEPKHSLKFSSMIGWFPKEQQRRAFNYYIERERAAPSQHFLHYNCWYDYGLDPTETKILASFEAYGNELVKKRGVKLDSVVLDDGWDYPVTGELWSPTPAKFPHGFKNLTKTAKKYKSNFGIWISPLGGYFDTDKRIASAKQIGGLSPDAEAFDLADPLYYNWFLKKCSDLVTKDGVNYFKWDKAGEGASMHFMRLCEISSELRKLNPNLYLNVTVGTWPSPFWLNHIDCTWRNGTGDVAWINTDIGDKRDQWISFRDQEAINCFAKKGPLYPLNSAMHHGIVLGTQMQGKDCAEAGTDMKREIRSYFALGPNLQEIYVDYKMVEGTPFWDQLAESVKWAKKHGKTLVDIHWVKGEPRNKEAYAFAAWHRGDGTIYLRNAAAEPKEISFTLAEAFELPKAEASAKYELKAAYADDADAFKSRTVPAGSDVKITLAPLQVLVLDATKK